MMGSMNFKYCCCARPFSPPFVRGAPSSREIGSTSSLGKFTSRFALTSPGAGEGELDAVEHARERGGRRRERRDAGSHRAQRLTPCHRGRGVRGRGLVASGRANRGGALMGDARAAYAARRRDRERGADERGGHVAQCGVCVCGLSKNARGGQWGRAALVPIRQFLSIVVTHASTRGRALLPLATLPPMSKRLVGSLFPDFDRISLKPDRR